MDRVLRHGLCVYWRNLWGGPVCAIIVATDSLDSTPIAFDRMAVRILVSLSLTVAEVVTLVRMWLLYRGVEQPGDGLACWCGESIQPPSAEEP